SVDEHLARYRINEYVRTLYDFFWHDYCDWYIEMLKVRLRQLATPQERAANLRFALSVFEDALGLLHPLMPFVTEEIWHRLGTRDRDQSLCVTLLPEYEPEYEQPTVERDMELVVLTVEQFRMLKAAAGLKPGDLPSALVRADAASANLIRDNADLIAALARVELPTFLDSLSDKPRGVLSAIVRDVELFLVVGEHVVERERERLLAERQRLATLLQQTQARLANTNFIERAKPDIVAAERAKESNFAEALAKVEESLRYLSEQS
ncbi:MAG: class I tRNA ligase family protein, partial [Chlorobi bacterium]|nr:class I tRNA ligase family protein [Chlorobiota bacterium]